MEKIMPVKQVAKTMPNEEAPPMTLPMTHYQNMPNPAAQFEVKKVTKSYCESHMHRYVEIQAVDGYCYDGIVEHVDEEWICLAVPGSADQMRGFFPPPPLYPPYGPFYPYRPRRFNRLILPLAALAALTLLPYYW